MPDLDQAPEGIIQVDSPFRQQYKENVYEINFKTTAIQVKMLNELAEPSNVETEINRLRSLIITVENDLNNKIDNEVEQLENYIDDEIGAVNDRIDGVESDIDDKYNQLNDKINNTKSELEDKVQEEKEALQEQIDALKDRLDNLDISDQLQEQLDQLTQDFEDRFTTIEGRLDGLDGEVQSLKDRLDPLEDTVSTLNNDVNDLKDRVTALEERADNVDTAIEGINEEIDTLQTDTDKLKENTEDLDGRLDVVEDKLEGLTSNEVVDTIADRDSLTPKKGELCWVKDATSDPTVDTGSAEYLYDGNNWVKVAETESMDKIFDWDSVENKPDLVEIYSTTIPSSNVNFNDTVDNLNMGNNSILLVVSDI